MLQLLSSNLKYYEEKILPFRFKVYTKDGSFTIQSSINNFKHLVCGTKVKQEIQNIKPSKFYNKVKNNKITIFNLIDKNNYNNSKLRDDEINILNKNIYFEDAFDGLTKYGDYYRNTDVYYSDGELQYTYLRLTIKTNMYIYLCICKDSVYDYYVFNSIVVSDYPIKGLIENAKRIKVTKVEALPYD